MVVRSLAALVALVTAGLALAGCAGGDAVYGEDAAVITAEPGERFVIELESNPSIGDDWRLDGPPEAAVATLAGQEQTYGSDAPGSGGTARFTFEAVAPGETEIVLFDCYRCGSDAEPLPENEALSRTVTFRLTVR